MATDITKPVVPVKPKTKEDAIAHLEELKGSLNAYAGRPGFNVFMYAAQKINPILNVLKSGKIVEMGEDGVASKSRTALPNEIDKAIADAFLLNASEENFSYKVVDRTAPDGANAYGALTTAGANVIKPVENR